jgi:hypothetical protein
MRKRHASLHMVDDKRLRVKARVVAGGAVAYMADGHLPLSQAMQHGRCEYFVDKARIPIGVDQAVVVDSYAAAFCPRCCRAYSA